MKKIILAIMLALAPIAYQGCQSAPTERVATVHTLQAIGASADAAMKTAASMYHNGQITEAQWQKVADFYTTRYNPAYALAVAAVSADYSTPASPDLVNLVSQLASLVAELEKK